MMQHDAPQVHTGVPIIIILLLCLIIIIIIIIIHIIVIVIAIIVISIIMISRLVKSMSCWSKRWLRYLTFFMAKSGVTSLESLRMPSGQVA